jgi:hypothetical protein
MKIQGSLITNGKSIARKEITVSEKKPSFHDRLEEAFITLCRELMIPVPEWIDKNTRELSMCKKTSFYPDQFHETFTYDRFELLIEGL